MSTITKNISEERQTKEKAQKFLLWLAIGSIVMLFAALTSAYIVRKGDGNWSAQYIPQTFYLSTTCILLSSIFMNWALSSAKKDNQKNLKNALLITMLLGLGFVYFQFSSWKDMVSHNIFFSGSNASGSYLYALSGIHLLHLIGGFIGLMVVTIKAFLKKYDSENYHGMQLCAIYWHFLDFLWVYLLLFLLFIR
jgi:cytochrome c oxidase subunit 3